MGRIRIRFNLIPWYSSNEDQIISLFINCYEKWFNFLFFLDISQGGECVYALSVGLTPQEILNHYKLPLILSTGNQIGKPEKFG